MLSRKILQRFIRNLSIFFMGLSTFTSIGSAMVEEKEDARVALQEFLGVNGDQTFQGYSNFSGLPCLVQVHQDQENVLVTLNGKTTPGSSSDYAFQFILNADPKIIQKSLETTEDRIRLKGSRQVIYHEHNVKAPQILSIKKAGGQLHTVYVYDWEAAEYTMSMTCVINP